MDGRGCGIEGGETTIALYGNPLLRAALVSARLSVKNNGDNHAVETQHFGENENKHHADEEAGLLSSAADTRVTDNADGEPSGETGKADRETRAKIQEAPVKRGEKVGNS